MELHDCTAIYDSGMKGAINDNRFTVCARMVSCEQACYGICRDRCFRFVLKEKARKYAEFMYKNSVPIANAQGCWQAKVCTMKSVSVG